MEIREKNVLLIDAMNLIHRSYYAYPRLTTKDGIPTGAFFGFVKYLKSLEEKFKPDHMIVCSDAHRKSFRTDMYPEYKGNRSETDDELRTQFGFMEEYLKLCNAKFIKMDNYEADDLIGTLAKKANEHGYFAYVVSGDRDLFQLIDDNIHQVYLSTKGMQVYDKDALKERYDGLSPEQIVDLKAMSGDQSDNIPGIKGIGEKTAIPLLNEFGSLDGIYENIDKIKGKKQEKFINDKDQAYLSRELAKIHTSVDIDAKGLFTRDEHFSLCTNHSYDYLQELNIKVFKKEDILQVPKMGLSLPFEIMEESGDINFRSVLKYPGSVSKEAMEIYVYDLLMDEKNREALKRMLINAKKNLIMEDETNKEEIEKIEEKQRELWDLLFSSNKETETSKQIPLKANSLELGDHLTAFFCKKCNGAVGNKDHYCTACGQKLDWSS